MGEEGGIPVPHPIFWSNFFFLRKIGVNEREGVDEQQDKHIQEPLSVSEVTI